MIETFDNDEDMFAFLGEAEAFDVDKVYRMCHVDSDTILFRASTTCQTNFIMVTHKASGRVKRFKGVQEFYGRKKSKDGGWLGETNAKRVEEGKSLFTYEDFSIEQCSELAGEEDAVLANAMHMIDFTIGRLKKVCNARDYTLYIGGEGNYRYDQAHIIPYKGERPEKPMMFLKLRELFIDKYKNKIRIVDGMEADDRLGIISRENYKKYLETGEWEDCLSYIDKDLKMCISPYLNYDKPELGIMTPTFDEGMKYFFKQLLTGDSTDNIQGLPNVTQEVKEKFKLKRSGVGPVAAKAIIDEYSLKECLENLVFCYKSYYGTDEHNFTSWRGETFSWTWLDYLRENAILLWMRIEEDEIFEIEDMLKEYGVDYV